jgi:hypothetical protein
MRNVHIDAGRDYQPGDPRLEGYLQWHDWAAVQHKAGLRQVRCGQCGLWKYPQELSGEEIVSHPMTGGGVVVTRRSPVCKQCAGGEREGA